MLPSLHTHDPVAISVFEWLTWTIKAILVRKKLLNSSYNVVQPIKFLFPVSFCVEVRICVVDKGKNSTRLVLVEGKEGRTNFTMSTGSSTPAQ